MQKLDSASTAIGTDDDRERERARERERERIRQSKTSKIIALLYLFNDALDSYQSTHLPAVRSSATPMFYYHYN